MPRNVSTGVYTRVVNSFSQPVFGTLIDPTDADAYFDDLDVGLNPPNLAGPVSIVGAMSITSASATAFTVGLNGATNPAFQIDDSTALQVAGLKVVGAVTGGTVQLSTTDSGSNANLRLDSKGSGQLTLNATATGPIVLTRATTISAALTYGGVTLSNSVTGTGSMALSADPTFTGTMKSAAHIITSASANALAVGLNGSTNPALVVDASAATQAAGLKIVGVATGGTVLLSAIDSGAATNLQIDSKGGGQLTFNATATGPIVLTRATTISAALTYGGVTLSNSVTGTGSMVLSSGPTVTLANATGLPLATGVTGNLLAANACIVSSFSVNKNSTDQTGVVSATFTAVTWSTELYDVDAHFASNGWTPNAGKVTMTAAFFATGTITAGSSAAIAIFKNGANYKQTSWGAATGAASATISTDDIANGTDVYTVQAFITTTAGTATITGNPGNTYFTGHWISP